MKLPLQASIVLAILGGLLVPATLMGYFTYTQNLKQARASQQNDHQRFLDMLVLGMREPLWNMSPEGARPLVDSVIGDERVVRITVNGSSLGNFLHANRPDRRLGQLTQITRTIYKQGAMIGSVTLEMDDGLVIHTIERNQLYFLLGLLAQVTISLGLCLYLIKKRILSPLRTLTQQADKLAANELGTPFVWHRYDEIGHLGSSLEETRQSLFKLIGKLEQKNVQMEAELISRQQTEAALLASQNRAFRLLETSQIVPWEANSNEWRFTFVGSQAEHWLDLPLSEWYSEDFFSNYLHQDDRHLIYALFTNQQHEHQHFECRLRKKDGQIIWVQCMATCSLDPQGRRILHGFMIDISAQKKIEAELESYRSHLEELLEQRTRQLATANHELETFSQSLSHDLRTPLRAIDGFSQILVEDYAEQLDGSAHNYLHRIRGTVNNMASLIDDLLNLVKLSNTEVHRQDADLSAMVSDIQDEMSVLHLGREVSIEIMPDVHAHVDPKLMRIALYNLLDNAWKFTITAPKPIIRFGTRFINGKDVFFVSDNGVGFDMAQLNKLFNPFQRLHNQAEYHNGGNGVGLAIVQRIISRHDGRVWAKSMPDDGATFYFTLP